MDQKQQSNEAMLEAETAIRQEVRKNANLSFEELSPLIRELLAKVYIRGAIDAIERLRKTQKEILEKVD